MAGAERGGAYSTQDACADTLDVMNRRLSQDLRNRVRRVAHYPVLTAEWREVSEAIHHLSQVAVMEARETTKRDGSVWERDELCVRYIIEESKTNLLVRLMVDYKEYACKLEMMSTPVDAETAGMMKTFEASLGELLRCLLRAVEALQTLDIQNLVEYCEGILNAAVTNDVTDMQSQEVLCVSYFHELARNLERLDEDKVMGLLLEHHVVPLLLQHFEAYRAKVTETDVEMFVWLFAHLFDTEHFQGHRKEYITTADDKRRLALLEPAAKAIKATESDAEKRKKLRALCDVIIRYK